MRITFTHLRFLAFAVATIFPAPFLIIGALTVARDSVGGWAVWVALLYITAFVFLMDEYTPRARDTAEAPPHQTRDVFANVLSFTLAVLHFLLLALLVWSLGGGAGNSGGGSGEGSGEGSGISLAQKIALFWAGGLYLGQVSNANAHELIHRNARSLRHLGKWIYISLLFGHHNSAHLLVHHIHVATPNDPNTARLGESFYRYFPRAWLGSFRHGLRAEHRRLAQTGARPWGPRDPYVTYLAGAAGFMGLSWLIAGSGGIGVYLGLALYAQIQLLLSDYVQHYGLERTMFTPKDKTQKTRYEPVAPRHSWNSPHRLSSLMMLNAPRHSDHHAHPAKPFPALRLSCQDGAPTLPYSLPAMATLALWPRMWHKVMTRRITRPQPGGHPPL